MEIIGLVILVFESASAEPLLLSVIHITAQR